MEARLPPEKLCRATLDAATALNPSAQELSDLVKQGYSLFTPSKPPSYMKGARAAVSLTRYVMI
ncbi:hypothetical protein EYZ11_010319 [Aspergillus tanneri]|uniref:Uncharacterized protein n=1 Tax=Aspergillus tanneri TaxID=1220188 RepID=A0A4S3J5N7_9EURO|nr:hypothetical protein EYZ11_010319 [Aspergillus tanneri]